ncbi:MAG: tetratricopeptide repeat protein [Salinivirgaceae bacterium]|nr:tetratricopeptide repeat protein [Salinivirgaceae bacterium]
MILRICVAVALIFSVLSSAAAPNAPKFKELFAKYEECYDANDYHGSVKYLEEALPYIHPDSIIWFSDAYNGLSYAYYDLGQYDKAIAYGNRSLECDLQIGDST